MHRTSVLSLLCLLWATPAPAHVGDSCELNSECDSGEACHLGQCVPRQSVAAPLDDAPDKPPGRRPSQGSVCMTSADICTLPAPGRSGSVCYCTTANGPVGGIIP